ncbi:MAG TPA: hypothetical protein VG297_14195 [Bryobacteraceae bacterium]|nr:hypothetical protein [Bryobacteraceae bacterium]
MIISRIARSRGFARLILLAVACMPFVAVAQTSAERAAANPLAVFPFDRATAPIDDADSVVLPGHIHPMAVPANDAGPVAGTFPMNRMILTLTRSAEQQSAVEAYAAALQNPQYFGR